MWLLRRLEAWYVRLHRFVYVRTDGRVGHGMSGVPALILRTKGRQSGRPRTNVLVYARDGDDYVLVASNSGTEHSPGWYFNLSADPNVELQVRRRRIGGVATVVSKGNPDYDRLWRLVNDSNKDRYDEYQKKTTRPIPLVVVRPN
ncbi:MAG: nitroreductase family deazaflavin-dependent oxidoreductase [Candidatus Limnocylindrales bacterium]